MTPARRLLLPLLIPFFLIISLFAAKQALAAWIFDFDPPTLCVTFDDTSLNQNCPTPQTTGGDPKTYPTLTDGSTTATFKCDDGTSPWSSGCKSLTYTILFYTSTGEDTAARIGGTCQDEEACDEDGNATNQIVVKKTITPGPSHREVRVQPTTLDKAGNNKSLDYRFNSYPYKISGFIWIDTNKDVVRNVNPEGKFTEDCYGGTATITLSDALSGSTTYPGSLTTAPLCDTYRYYSFNVPAGTYTVTLTQIPEYSLTDSQTWAQSVSICNNDNPPVCSDKEIDWGITDASVWWQTKLGDVRAGSGRITDSISAKCNGQCQPYVSLTGNSSAGIVFYATTFDINSLNPNARPSVPNWRVQSGFTGTLYSYDYVNNQVSQPLPFTGAQPAASGTYKSDVGRSIDSAWSIPAGQKIVILVNGNLNINQTIDVAAGGFLAFYVKGNINIAGDIGGAVNQDTPQLEGIYIADGSFNTGSSNKRLNIEGTVVAGSISQDRDILGGGNKNPSFYVAYRPDFLLSAPPAVQSASFLWQEVAP